MACFRSFLGETPGTIYWRTTTQKLCEATKVLICGMISMRQNHFCEVVPGQTRTTSGGGVDVAKVFLSYTSLFAVEFWKLPCFHSLGDKAHKILLVKSHIIMAIEKRHGSCANETSGQFSKFCVTINLNLAHIRLHKILISDTLFPSI